jgi:hypothetical protein
MGRIVVILVVAVGCLAAGCNSNSNSLICCITVNGDQGAWSCPNEAAYTACCGPTNGCLTDAGTCTTVNFQSECG